MASIRSPRVVVYHSTGCHLCERVLQQVRDLRDELRFDLREVDISVRGVPNDGRSSTRGMPLDEWAKAMDAAKAAGDRKRMDELRRIAAAR